VGRWIVIAQISLGLGDTGMNADTTSLRNDDRPEQVESNERRGAVEKTLGKRLAQAALPLRRERPRFARLRDEGAERSPSPSVGCSSVVATATA
jgi:hypothetical protein